MSAQQTARVIAICISSMAGAPMRRVDQVLAQRQSGLAGDRYASGDGSFNKKRPGARQVTFINGMFFEGSGFEFEDSRRNIVTEGVELNWLVGREFQIGTARFRGVKYCDPCDRPSKLAHKDRSFREAFFDRGGIVAEVIHSGIICVGNIIVTPEKGY